MTEPDLHFEKNTPCCTSGEEKVGSGNNSRRPAKGSLVFGGLGQTGDGGQVY